MGIVRSLFGWMQATPASGDNPALYPLDFDELKKELSVVDEARRMGVHNNPPEDKTGLSAIVLMFWVPRGRVGEAAFG